LKCKYNWLYSNPSSASYLNGIYYCIFCNNEFRCSGLEPKENEEIKIKVETLSKDSFPNHNKCKFSPQIRGQARKNIGEKSLARGVSCILNEEILSSNDNERN
jgi:hypothetical protein